MKRDRIASVDFLRGITVILMILVNTPGSWSHVYAPLLHAKWNGLTFADLVFPFFLFIMGISISIVFNNKKINSSVLKKITIRSFKLILIGLFLNAFIPYFPFFTNLESIRIPGVLQRIGIVFFFTSLFYLICNKKSFYILTTISLIGYWLWIAYLPIPKFGTVSLEQVPNNWIMYIDMLFLEGHTWLPDYDPEGILSTIPSISTACIGVIIGGFFHTTKNKQRIFLLLGIILLSIGYLWSFTFPINKNLWTSSFALVTSGYATLILSFFYYFLDIRKINLGTAIIAVGTNPIIIYFSSMFIAKCFYLLKINSKTNIHDWLFNNFFINQEIISLKTSSLLYAITVILFYILFAYILYKKKIFIKV